MGKVVAANSGMGFDYSHHKHGLKTTKTYAVKLGQVTTAGWIYIKGTSQKQMYIFNLTCQCISKILYHRRGYKNSF